MADDILVTISAQIDQLISGFNEASEATAETLKKLQEQVGATSDAIQNQLAPASESANEALTNLSAKFDQAFEVAKVVAAIEFVKHFGEELDDLALKAIHAGQSAQMLGISTPELQGLHAAAEEAGVGTEVLDRSLLMLSLRLQQARDGSAGMQEKLEKVGITIKDLEDPTFTAASAAVQLAESHADASLKLDVVGRRGAALLPVLQSLQGGEQGAIDKAKELGATTAQETADLALYHRAITEAGERWDYFKTTIAASVAPALAELVNQFAQLVAGIDLGKSSLDAIGEASRSVSKYFLGVAERAREMIIEAKGDFEQLKAANQNVFETMGAAMLHHFADAAKIWKEGDDEQLAIQKKTDAAILASREDLARSLKAIDLSALTGVTVTAHKTPTVPLDVKVKPNEDLWMETMYRIDEKTKSLLEKDFKEITNSAVASAKEQEEAQIGNIDRQIGAIHALGAVHRISVDAELQETVNLLNAKWHAQQEYYAKARALAQSDLKTLDAIDKQEEKDYQAHLTALQKATEVATKQMDKQWKSVVDRMSNEFASNVVKMIRGTETLSQAMRNVFANMVESIISNLVKIGIQMVLNAAISKATGTDAAKTNVLANASQAASGAMASAAEIPIVGWILAPLAGAAVYAAALAYGVPSAAGGWEVPSDTLAMVHKNEMILPADISQGFKGMLTAGGGADAMGGVHHWNLTFPSLDPKSAKDIFTSPAGRKMLTDSLTAAYRRGVKGTRR